MKEIFSNIKSILKYGRPTLVLTWLFFFILSASGESKHGFIYLFLFSGLFTFMIVVIAATFRYLKLL